MAETLKLSYHLKFDATAQYTSDPIKFEQLMENWGNATIFTFNHIEKTYFSYRKEQNPKIAKCIDCNEEKELAWKHKTLNVAVCNRCFLMKWSRNTLTLKDGFLKELINNFPELATHKGYYNGAIKYAIPMFKSYLSKLEEREKEIQQLKTSIVSATNIRRQLKLQRKLKKKEQGIKELHFRKNVIYLGSGSMFDFKYEKDTYWLGIAHPHILRKRIWFQLRIGMEKSYKTEHNKHKLMQQLMKNKEHKKMLGKIIKRDNYYEFMLPRRFMSMSMTTHQEIEKFIPTAQNHPIVCISYGINPSMTLVTLIDDKITEIKRIGDGRLWHFINRERAYRAKVMQKFTNKYKGKWKRNKKRKQFFRKRGEFERRFIKYYTHALTKQLINYLKEKYPTGCTIIVRDTKHISHFSYNPPYSTVLSRWNIQMQKQIQEYKALINNINLYKVQYKESNNLSCSRCGKEFKDDKKEIKTLTVKLQHGIYPKLHLQQKIHALERKLKKLQTYPKTEKNAQWLRETTTELNQTKEKFNNTPNKTTKLIRCDCGYTQNFYINDALLLYNTFKKSISHSSFLENNEAGEAQAV